MKSFVAVVRVIALPAAEMEVVPSTSKAPDCVTSPPLVKLKFPVASDAANVVPEASVMITSVPAKSREPKFAVVPSPSVIALPLALKVARLVTSMPPLSVMVSALTVRVSVAAMDPRSIALSSVIWMASPAREIAPVKSLVAVVSVIAFPNEVIDDDPSMSRAPVWVTSPLFVKLKLPVASEAASSVALPSTMETVDPEKSTLPKFAVVVSPSAMMLPFASKVARLVTLISPLSVIASASTVRVSVAVMAPRSMALSSVI